MFITFLCLLLLIYRCHLRWLSGRISPSISEIRSINNTSIKTVQLTLYIMTDEEASAISSWLTHIDHTGNKFPFGRLEPKIFNR